MNELLLRDSSCRSILLTPPRAVEDAAAKRGREEEKIRTGIATGGGDRRRRRRAVAAKLLPRVWRCCGGVSTLKQGWHARAVAYLRTPAAFVTGAHNTPAAAIFWSNVVFHGDRRGVAEVPRLHHCLLRRLAYLPLLCRYNTRRNMGDLFSRRAAGWLRVRPTCTLPSHTATTAPSAPHHCPPPRPPLPTCCCAASLHLPIFPLTACCLLLLAPRSGISCLCGVRCCLCALRRGAAAGDGAAGS